MQWASTVVEENTLSKGIERAARNVLRQLAGHQPDLLIVFASEQYGEAQDQIPERLSEYFGPTVMIGCSAGGVIGGGHEVENRPGLSLTAAVLPDVSIVPFHLEPLDLPAWTASAQEWRQRVGIDDSETYDFVLLADPFTADPESMVDALDRVFPTGSKVGGLASGGRQPGDTRLFLGSKVNRAGVVGIALRGNIAVETIVAQGCRPVAQPLFVTSVEGNLIHTLDGKPAYEVLAQVYWGLGERDRELAKHSLFLGIAMPQQRQTYTRGHYLIRNLLGVSTSSGSIAVGAGVEENSIVQFHLRDERTSDEDLEYLLTRFAAERRPDPACGALLFSCVGRGVMLYGESDHDTDAFRQHLGNVPLGGFFCNGEIGPVNGRTFVHGYTSAFALFGPAHPK